MRKVSQIHRLTKLTVYAFLFLLPASGWGSVELDRKYSLETIGYLRAWDNVDGLFADYVDEAYQEYFKNQSRFRRIDLSRADEILARSKVDYRTWIEDEQVLRKIARQYQVQSLVRTKVYKEGPHYRFQLDWLHSPKMELLAKHTFRLEHNPESTQSNGAAGEVLDHERIRAELKKGLETLIVSLPFVAEVTGRDSSWVTVNVGTNARLKKGDILVVGTIEEVKFHPLLSSLVDWKIIETGRLEVDLAEESIAFCKVIHEEPEHQISRSQKITKILPQAEDPKTVNLEKEDPTKNAILEQLDPPTLGWLAGHVNAGPFSREFSQGTGTAKSGSGFGFGGNVRGELWLTRAYFVNVGFGYTTMSYGERNAATVGADTSIGSSSVTDFYGSVGYTYYVRGDLYGPRAYAKLGYRSVSYTFPSTATTGATSFTGLFLGVGGDMPLRDQYGVLIDFTIGLFKSASGTVSAGTLGGASGVSDFSFFVGGYYRLSHRLSARFGVDVMGQSADFSSTENSSVSHTLITFTPSIQYYF